MSIKRSKTKVERRSAGGGSGFGFGTSSPQKEPTWQEAVADQPDDAFTVYSMSERYTPGALLNHAAFGKGIVLSLDGRKMNVLFSDCKKILTMGA